MKKIVIIICTLLLTACASQVLKQSKQDFNSGNYPAAMEKLMPLAEKGDPRAEYAVGYMYYNGEGVTKNKALGEDWIDKAAAQGYVDAIKAQAIIKKRAELNPLKH